MNDQSAAASGPIASFIPELDTPATATMTDWKVPGVALAVVQGGKVALVRAKSGGTTHRVTLDAASHLFPKPDLQPQFIAERIVEQV